MSTSSQSFADARATLQTSGGRVEYVRLNTLVEAGYTQVERLPLTLKILLENVLRKLGNGVVRESEVESLARWSPGANAGAEFPFYPARVLLQDFTGVPTV